MTASAEFRRLALQHLNRERLVSMCAAVGVKAVDDRRSRESYVEALIHAPGFDFASLLTTLRRSELQAICHAFGLGRDARDKKLLVTRILDVTRERAGEETLAQVSEFALTAPTFDDGAHRRRRISAGPSGRVKRLPTDFVPGTGQIHMPLAARTRASPFVKWVGGKRQLLSALLPHVPRSFGTYFEPFLGGGALFFHLSPRRAVLGDSNERLIRAYRGVRRDVQKVIRLLGSYPHTKRFYLDQRAKSIDGCTDEEVAAWLIYLNKTGYNGLYRVNSRNIFNVPYGDYKKPNICDSDTLLACAEALRHATLEFASFETTTRSATEGDFVYFDPPYVPRSISSYFTSYTASGFGLKEHEHLRDVALRLKRRGVRVIVSNSATDTVEHLYGRDFKLIPVLARRRVNRDTTKRGPVKEYIIS